MIARAVNWWARLVRRSMRSWLRNNPKHRQTLRKFRCFSTDPEAVSRGVGIGLFFGLTPTVGLQTMLALPSCLFLRGNFPFAFMATWVTNPLTIPPAYYLFNQVGGYLYPGSLVSVATAAAYPWLDLLTSETLQFALGSLVIATPTAIMGYFTVNWILKRQHKRHRLGSGLMATDDKNV